jgi:hypothetical protein
MYRASPSLGALAAALAKAQGELANPEKALTASLPATAGGGARSFRYASLASGLDIVRRCLGRHAIATMQTSEITDGHVCLTTVLAHASGEWIASDLPVGPITLAAVPHRLGAALTYVRRYALFALVGIAGEDDLDAPDLIGATAELAPIASGPQERHRSRGSQPHELAPTTSAILRDQMLAELDHVTDADALAVWTQRRMRDKNSLTRADALIVERAGLAILSQTQAALDQQITDRSQAAPPEAVRPDDDEPVLVTPRGKPLRRRSKAHLAFVAAQPCLVCRRKPCDAHHLKFAQPRALSRKVSDEFTVPLCRAHHNDLHRHGNERAWWSNLKLEPLPIAKALWQASPVHSPPQPGPDPTDRPTQPMTVTWQMEASS